MAGSRGKHAPSLTFIQALSPMLKTYNSSPWSFAYLLSESLENIAIAHIHSIFSKYYNLAKFFFPSFFLKDRDRIQVFFFCWRSSIPCTNSGDSSDIHSIEHGQRNVTCLASFFDNNIRCLESIISGQMVTSLSFQLSVHPIWFSLYAAVLKNLLNSVTVYSALMQKKTPAQSV